MEIAGVSAPQKIEVFESTNPHKLFAKSTPAVSLLISRRNLFERLETPVVLETSNQKTNANCMLNFHKLHFEKQNKKIQHIHTHRKICREIDIETNNKTKQKETK